MKGVCRLLVTLFGPPVVYLICQHLGTYIGPICTNSVEEFVLAPVVGAFALVVAGMFMYVLFGFVIEPAINWIFDGFEEDRKELDQRVKRTQLIEAQGGAISITKETGTLSVKK